VQRAEDEGYQAARASIYRRCGGRCEGCRRLLAWPLMHAHHRKPRSAGRDDSDANLLALCSRCHDRAHREPAWARSVGWVISRYDQREPQDVPWYPLPRGGSVTGITQHGMHGGAK
jgi:5-methylcytosine-specific restriction endonuclease McrA